MTCGWPSLSYCQSKQKWQHCKQVEVAACCIWHIRQYSLEAHAHHTSFAPLVCVRDGAELTYKYVVRNASTLAPVRWQEGTDCTLRLPEEPATAVVVREAWDASHREVEVEPLASTAALMAAAEPETGAPRRVRRKKASSSISAVGDEAETLAAISRAADRALQQLDAAVTASMELLDGSDPASPELLVADRVVAAAARRATAMTKALDAAGQQLLLSDQSGVGGGKGKRKQVPKQQPQSSSE